MLTQARKLLTVTLVTMMVLLPFQSAVLAQSAATYESTEYEVQPDGAVMTADFVLMRPLGIASMALGLVFFVVTLPFSAFGGNTDEAFDEMIAKPAKFTFARPLGHFYSRY